MQPGDIIYTIYNQQRHFGIYVDESNVIHCVPLRYAKCMPLHYMASVVRATLKEFAMGRDIYRLDIPKNDEEWNEAVQRYQNEKRRDNPSSWFGSPVQLLEGVKSWLGLEESRYPFLFTPEETIGRARSLLNVLSAPVPQNYEHFAIWCKTGITDSRKISKILEILLETNSNPKPIVSA